MLRRVLGGGMGRFKPPVRMRWIGRYLCTRTCLVPLLVFLAACALEVWMHQRQFDIALPAEEMDLPFHTGCQEPDVKAPREKAALVMLARNKELTKAIRSLQSIEDHFNRWFHYPYVFLNDEPWSEDFQQAVRAVVSSEAHFEVIPRDQWTFPAGLDVDAARQSIRQQGQAGILYAGMETYHHMCRFYSKNFYTLDALRDYKWYWRIEPDVDFHCAITYDPFREMARNNKAYGFTIALPEEPRTCPSLFPEMADWKDRHQLPTTELWKAMMAPSRLPWFLRGWAARWLGHRDRRGDAWSMCHYWSNFEIADLDFFRGKGYQDMVNYLDGTGKFYTERVSFGD
jgi:mannosyltransferase